MTFQRLLVYGNEAEVRLFYIIEINGFPACCCSFRTAFNLNIEQWQCFSPVVIVSYPLDLFSAPFNQSVPNNYLELNGFKATTAWEIFMYFNCILAVFSCG